MDSKSNRSESAWWLYSEPVRLNRGWYLVSGVDDVVDAALNISLRVMGGPYQTRRVAREMRWQNAFVCMQEECAAANASANLAPLTFDQLVEAMGEGVAA